MPNTLGLDDDLDGVEVLQDLERVFDIQVSNEEAVRIMTVGDFFDLLVDKIPPNSLDKKCVTAMAFYRLRRAIHDLGYGDASKPSSDIRFLDQGNVKAKLKHIERASGLHLPSSNATTLGCVVALVAFLAVPTAAYLAFPSPVSAVFGFLAGIILGGTVLRYIDPGRLPKDCNTLADLARKTAALSFGRLVKAGGSHSNQDVWENLVEALSNYQLAKSEITRETFFLKSQMKNAEA